ncbi:MAG: serine/threonine protein kinase [Deltaproteobacteria bacterium]|nr:serine/threonine protein kinase [Deltaproteobacteria bacterium]
MDAELRPGDRYGPFEILAPMGTGTFARVYAVRAPGYAYPVAFKLSRSIVESEATALRALREVRVLESLRNHHVVRIFDYGVGEDDRWFMLMELLEGAELSQVHDFDAPMDPVQAARLIYEAGVGLDEAHVQGIVHRDVKPDNLWIQRDGSLKVIDFGLARAWDPLATVGLTATTGHMLVGTPHYTQPEQLHGTELVPASDVYSLGLVLYELLSAHMPLFAKDKWSVVRDRLLDEPLEWLSAHVKRPLVPLDKYKHCKGLPKRLIALVHAMLEKQPDRRPATGGVVAQRLAAILEQDFGVPVAASLRLTGADQSVREQLLIPGYHKIGTAQECAIQVASDGTNKIRAELDWIGPPDEALLWPKDCEGLVRVNGELLDCPVRLLPGAVIEVGGARLELTYPPQR